MLTRLLLILALLLQPASITAARSCGAGAGVASHESAAHECCCGDACPARAAQPTYCGCGESSNRQPEPQAPRSPEAHINFALAPLAWGLPPAEHDDIAQRVNCDPVPIASPVALNVLYCVWLT